MSDEIQTVETTAPSVDTGSAPAADAPKPSLEETLTKTAEAVFAREPVRGGDGRFQPKVAAPGAPEGVEVPGGPQTAPVPDPAPPVIEAPQSLPADVKGKWPTLPPEVQKYWADRESEIHKKFTTDGERLKAYEGIDAALETAKGFLEQNRIPKAEYIRRLAAADHMLRTNPQQALAEIARMYGINGAVTNPGAQPDPNSALAREFSQLQQKVEDLTRSSEVASLKAAQETIDSFKKDKPHFDAVADLMDELIRTKAADKVPGEATLLEKAYTLAITLHPEVKAKIEKDAADAAAKKAAEEAKEKAAKDAKIAPFATRPGSANAGPVKGKNIWDTLQKVGDQVYARS